MIWPFRKAPTMSWTNDFLDSHALVHCTRPVAVYRFDGRYWSLWKRCTGVLVKGTGVWNRDMYFLPEDMLRPKPGYLETLKETLKEMIAARPADPQATAPTPPASPDARP